MSGREEADRVLDLLATRRVCRDFAERQVAAEDLVRLLDGARWASSAGNARVQRFLVLQDAEHIRLARAMAPGVLAQPPAIIAICNDLWVASRIGVRAELDPSVQIDVGTTAMAMMTVAHALGLGTCPATSFSTEGVRTVLRLPASTRPEMLLLVGYPRHPIDRRPPRRPSPLLAELAYWEEYGEPPPPGVLRRDSARFGLGSSGSATVTESRYSQGSRWATCAASRPPSGARVQALRGS